ncbi:MAG TPA: POTRA domain-containing protein, partial [Gammaproteobacteria bacterium]|nr:POTRA domain-containing protein [Gammaproteobacteria bacterium]
MSRILAGVAVSLVWAAAGAATVPRTSTPGAQQNRTRETQQYYQQRKKNERPRVPENPIVRPGPPPQGKGAGHKGPAFVLKDVRFNKSHFLKPRVLAGVVKPYLDHKVTVADLRTIVARINKLYTRRDIYTAKAVLPPQRIRHGVVHIELVEGRLGKLQIQGNHYTKGGFIRARVSQQPGQVVDGAVLKDDLVFFNRTSDMQLRAVLRPGAEKGLTRILLMAQEPPRVQVGVFVDDAGSTSTGRYRAGATFRLHGPLRIDDRLDGYFVGSRGARDGFVSYSVPVNDRNGRLGVSYSRDSINIIKGPSQALDITGHASTETVQ